MKYNFDETGVNFNYFLLCFLVLSLVPTTISLILSRRADLGAPKTAKHYKSKYIRRQQPLVTKKFLFVALGWIATAFLIRHIQNTHVETAVAWDPFEILSLPTSSDHAQIKKQYRRLSLQWHPDKVEADVREEAADKYVQIAKAYKVLTDDAARENYEKYGHPDGRQTYDMVIALPQWLVESSTSPFVLALYGLVFGLLMPLYVGRWWYRSMRYTKERILNRTMGLFFKEIKEGVTVPDLIDLLTASAEFEQNPGYGQEDESELPALADRVRIAVETASGEPFERSIKFKSDVAYKAKVLLYAHLYRVEVGNDRLREQQQIVVIQSLHLLTGVHAIVEAYNWLHPTLYTIELNQMLVQAIPHYGSPLLQLPHVTRDLVTEIEARRPQSSNVSKLRDLPEAEGRHLLSALAPEQYAETRAVMDSMPRPSVRDATFQVVGDEIITPRAIMTFTATLTTKGDLAPLTPVTPKVPRSSPGAEGQVVEDEDDGVGRLISDPLAALAEVPEVYAPYCSVAKHAFWWAVLGDPRSNRFTIDPIRITDLKTSKAIKVQFQAPGEPGTYALTLFIKSDSYTGCDVTLPLEFTVKSAGDLPYESEPEDDISEPEADSLAGQMAQMRNQQAGTGGVVNGDETSDDE
ncbi:secretory subunit [Tieghemiomyces parasiticus]|uniref:Secretory subunit n=1 Tax=Tieghemiomyces parasiticus TaxID=78921 RepID=A0A9W8E1U7_9FUNG|nr:secretory subunit [Tieghemiomyces parasiticus]